MDYKGAELWNKKLIDISNKGILRANAVIRANQENKVDQLKSRRKEKEEICTLNKSNLQCEEEFKRVQDIKSIEIKARKVKYMFCIQGFWS